MDEEEEKKDEEFSKYKYELDKEYHVSFVPIGGIRNGNDAEDDKGYSSSAIVMIVEFINQFTKNL